MGCLGLIDSSNLDQMINPRLRPYIFGKDPASSLSEDNKSILRRLRIKVRTQFTNSNDLKGRVESRRS